MIVANPSLPWTTATLLRKVMAGFALPVLLLLVIGILSFHSVHRFARDTERVARSHEVLAHLADTISALKDIETGTRGFVLTGDNAYLKPYFASQDTLKWEFQSIFRLTGDNLRQQKRLASFQPLIDKFLLISWKTIAERKAGNMETALVIVETGRGQVAMDRIRGAIEEMQDEERLLLEERRTAAGKSGTMTQGIILLALLGAVLVVTLAGMSIYRDIAARKRAEQEREAVIEQLREALATVKTLGGLLPICAWCKNIRDDQGYWKQLEEYIQDHSEANFTHGICPVCMEKQQAQFAAAQLG